MNKNSVKYLHCTSFLQVTVIENAGIKNLVHAGTDALFLSPHQAEYKLNPSAWSDGHYPHTVNITCRGVTGTARIQ